ncbi:MAG: hypothetical protein Q9222_006760 [Ikaeria aurantiellina]
MSLPVNPAPPEQVDSHPPVQREEDDATGNEPTLINVHATPSPTDPAPAEPVDRHVLVQHEAEETTSNEPRSTNGNAMSFSDISKKDADFESWRYRGYAAMTTWMASDDDFFVVRRFGKLAARVALLMQNRLTQLEDIIHTEDIRCMNERGDNGTLDHDRYPRRVDAMNEAAWRLKEYQRFILDHSELKARPEATELHISNVENWLETNNDPIRPEEVTFIRKRGDLVPMVSKEGKSPLYHFINRFVFLDRWGILCRKEKQVSIAIGRERLKGQEADINLSSWTNDITATLTTSLPKRLYTAMRVELTRSSPA